MDFSISDHVKKELLSVINSGRLAHTVIIESDDEKARKDAAVFLSAYAVCKEENRPCLECAACHKALSGIHPDVFVPELSGKLKQINIETSREIGRQASIIPNEANTRVFLFFDADKTMPVITQNALLKLIEEPPQSALFVFTVKKSAALLSTVRSRAQLITLKGEDNVDDFVRETSGSIIQGIVSLYEADLLKALSPLSLKDNKEKFAPTMLCLSESLRLALGFLCGVNTEDENALLLAKKLQKDEILKMLEITDDAVRKSQTNINMTLLTTWLCSQYRRILWQK
ncbi:MAG: hypothetical protein IJJ15_03215 [Ruminococcus sp.]|nr:hypothetical protein [Ruminococcus sp.]